MYILVEYAPYGDLLGYLRTSMASDVLYENIPNKLEVNNPIQRLNYFAHDIACGMEFLALNKVLLCIFCNQANLVLTSKSKERSYTQNDSRKQWQNIL